MSAYNTLNLCEVYRETHGTNEHGEERLGAVVVAMPRTSYAREEALMFAAWLVAAATVGEESSEEQGDLPGSPGGIISRVDAVRSAR